VGLGPFRLFVSVLLSVWAEAETWPLSKRSSLTLAALPAMRAVQQPCILAGWRLYNLHRRVGFRSEPQNAVS